MIVSSLAGTIETLFLGWEFVGLSSALLVAFFHERTNPVRNGQRVWTVYRIADAAFLIAALTLHHLTGAGDFDGLMGTGPWPEGQATISHPTPCSSVCCCWLRPRESRRWCPFPVGCREPWKDRRHRAPSSTAHCRCIWERSCCCGSVRFWSNLDCSCAAVVGIGLISAIFAALAARVQTDIKSALAFASLTQVGIIVAEIGCGLRYIALIHIIGHACLRTLQLLRAPTLLHDYHPLENAIGAASVASTVPGIALASASPANLVVSVLDGTWIP